MDATVGWPTGVTPACNGTRGVRVATGVTGNVGSGCTVAGVGMIGVGTTSGTSVGVGSAVASAGVTEGTAVWVGKGIGVANGTGVGMGCAATEDGGPQALNASVTTRRRMVSFTVLLAR
jgi:hypothetical protein